MIASEISPGSTEQLRNTSTDSSQVTGQSVTPPACPKSLSEAGVNLGSLCDLTLKHLYLQGHSLGAELARQLRLPFVLVEEALRHLKDERCLEVVSGDLIGPASYRFNLTQYGRERAQEAFDSCRYVGPAPVPLSDYVRQCQRQTVADVQCHPDELREAFADLIISDGLLDQIGPAVCTGKSMFVHGAPGNGKTLIASGLGQFLNDHGGEIFVPYAIEVDGSIITIFDPTIHRPTDNADNRFADASQAASALMSTPSDASTPDFRWRRVRRPVIVTGGELTLDMLDLRYNRESNFYTAPMHVKANGGIFLIDDFGRQIVGPQELLNRWILPLEDRVDYLTLTTGKKLAVPFESLIIFCTNLEPRELVDDAFLRRIRHKIEIGPPTREVYTEIFKHCCENREISFEPSVVDYLYTEYYDSGRSPRSSDPRDLLEIIYSICRFQRKEIELNDQLMAEATKRFFCNV
ncbi:ATP-binding protein [Thalassoroseus pseudoceratinae]|uniref:ATPase n=1 Tax=Thalassoroseus pseudoceratinae TaxID=2713176 RepID=UPI00197E15F6|nr:ATPase [Thalassoroseus pseudoceratinae]